MRLASDNLEDFLGEQERLANMGEMAAQLAHEIRNPLLAIGATLESLCREPAGERQRRMLESASREIARMDMVLRKYLSARHDLALVEVQLAELVNDVRRLLDGACKPHGKKITVDIDPVLSVWADHDSMKQVFFNLIFNALDASPANGEVICRARSSDRAVTVLIEDRGPGLEAPVSQCMKPFFTTKSNGTGLGLPVCLKMVQAHGGFLNLCDREDGGCRAEVVLPRRHGSGAR